MGFSINFIRLDYIFALILFAIIKLFEVISTVISTLKVGIEYGKKLKQLKNK